MKIGQPNYSDVRVLILAGSRAGETDPLCEAAGVRYKAELPINGRPMLDYVLEALDGAKLARPYHISGYDSDDPRTASAPSGRGPADSICLAAGTKDISYPLLITTCDHPLLDVQMIGEFIDGARASGGDICAGLASRAVIQPAYPDVKRTYLKFADVCVSGCNLFYLSGPKGLSAISYWQGVQHLRKKPLKMAQSIGPSVLWKYIRGKLTLTELLADMSGRIGANIQPVFMRRAEAAIDVDKPSDMVLVESILRTRSKENPTNA